jgi:ParB family transcriptional regulator, chromosome partitioning protein
MRGKKRGKMTASAAASAMEPVSQFVPLSRLVPSPFNPRKDFPKAELAELAASIEAVGLIEPLIVRPVFAQGAHGVPGDTDLEIIAGERRYRAAKMAKLAVVPVIIRPLDDVQARRMQIVENLHRAGVTPLEEARGYQELLKAANEAGGDPHEKLDVKGLARDVGKSKEYVYKRLELLKLAPPVQEALAGGKITPSHAQELVALKPEQQAVMARQLSTPHGGEMSVQNLRNEISYRFREKPKISKAEKARQAKATAEHKKQQERWKAEQARRDADREFSFTVDAKACALLWPKLEKSTAKDRDRWLDYVTGEALGNSGGAVAVALGKPLPRRQWIDTNAKALDKFSREQRLLLAILSIATDHAGNAWANRNVDNLYKWAGIDRKKLAAEVKAEAKVAAAEAVLHKPLTEVAAVDAERARRIVKKAEAAPGHALPTSAKPAAKRAKARKARTPRPTARVRSSHRSKAKAEA